MSASALILPTINAPYGAGLDAHTLAVCLIDVTAATEAIGPVYSFFSEVPPDLQEAFIAEMGMAVADVKPVAMHFAQMSGMELALAA